MEAKEDALFFLTFTPSTLSTVFPNRRSYVYRPLAEGFIRLLRIHPHPNPGATIECSILEYPLLSSQRTGLYEALSYVWGPPPPEENPPLILVDGREFVVGENLYAALLSLRDPWLERIIWIDAICINQRDDDEKGHQVGSMAKIYSRAREVLVWLGPATASSGRALKVIQSFATLSEDEVNGYPGPSKDRYVEARRHQDEHNKLTPELGLKIVTYRRTTTRAEEPIPDQEAGAELEDKLGIKELLERHWFKRIWVLQEVAAARHVVIKCGSDEVTGQAFCSGIEVLVRRWKAEQDGEMQFLDALFNSVTRLMRTADRRPRHEQDASPRFYLNISPVGDLIEMYGHREATDCRDKVYALLGMCSDDPGAAGLMPNYSISWESLIQQLMSFILKLSRPDVMNISANGDKIVIKSQGYVLGMVLEEGSSSISRQTTGQTTRQEPSMHLRWSKTARELGWIQRAQQTDLMWKDPVKGDVLFLLHGARVPMVIRPQKDYSTVVHIIAPDMPVPEIQPAPPSSELIGVLLVWDWAPVAGSSQPAYFMETEAPNNVKAEFGGDREKMDRLINTLLIRHSSMQKDGEEQSSRDSDWEERYCRLDTKSRNGWGKEPAQLEIELLELYETMCWSSTGDDRRTADAAIVKLLSRTSRSLDSDWPVCRSLLWLAALTEKKDLAQHILELGVVSGVQEMCWAIQEGHPAIAHFLFDTGRMAKDGEWWRPALVAWEAICYARWESADPHPVKLKETEEEATQILNRLMGMGTRIQEETLFAGVRKRSYAFSRIDWVISYAKLYQIDLQARDKHGRTLLLQAALSSNLDLICDMISLGYHAPDQTVQDNDGKTALMLAIDRKLYNRKTIKCLFEAGLGQLDVKDCQGRTPLMLAAYWRHKEIVRLIIDTGHHHINARDDNGDTALVYAMTTPSGGLHSRAHRTAMYLINRLADQIDLDVRDRHGRTILMLAARQGWGQVFSHLIETGHADLNAVDHEGRTALMHSLRGFPGSRIEMTLRIAICTILVDDRVNVEITDVNGESALTWMQEMQRKQRERDGKDGKDAKDDEWARYRRAQLQYHVEKIQSSFWSGRWGDLEDNDPEMVRPEEGWRMFAYPDDEVAASGL